MDLFVARANIDRYLDLLHTGNSSTQDRSVLNKLLIEEENKLGRDLEQLDFAEGRVASYRQRFNQICHWRDGFVDGSSERSQADRVVESFETTLQMMESFCGKMRAKVNASSL